MTEKETILTTQPAPALTLTPDLDAETLASKPTEPLVAAEVEAIDDSALTPEEPAHG